MPTLKSPVKFLTSERYIIVHYDGSPMEITKDLNLRKASNIKQVSFIHDFDMANFFRDKAGRDYTLAKVSFNIELVNLDIAAIKKISKTLKAHYAEAREKTPPIAATQPVASYENHERCPKCLNYTLPKSTGGDAVVCQFPSCGFIVEKDFE